VIKLIDVAIVIHQCFRASDAGQRGVVYINLAAVIGSNGPYIPSRIGERPAASRGYGGVAR
jgi:hypothetical protein